VLCHLPASRARLRLRLSTVDVALAAVSPVVALYLRNADVASNGDWIGAESYILVSLVFSLIAFQIAGISAIIPQFVSVSDLLRIAKVVLVAELMTAATLFTVTRLEGIPRSLPAIHALILGAALIAYRGLGNLAGRRGDSAVDNKNVIVIGLNDWSVLLIRHLQASPSERQRVIALLDDDPRWIGRSVNAVQVLGPAAHLEAAIEEFATHGLRTDRVIVGAASSELSHKTLTAVRDVCAQRDLDLVFVPRPSALCSANHKCRSSYKSSDRLTSNKLLPSIWPTPYFRHKRAIDIMVALALIVVVLPLFLITALMVLFDIGWPVVFWQQRTGQGGRELQLYKLRTLRPPFDRTGQRVPEEQRVSGIGRLLRKTRFDELPQLFNVLVGDMSLIGPRPLLPRDQPSNAAPRLTVRPGITGWAQVNGGILLSASEKDALDIWYIRNASLWLDLRIIWMTCARVTQSDRRSDNALAQAMRSHHQQQASSEVPSS
jgi:lipopolysaccharide/colanic/teichoic acid biosynthesis glycosyltransferase